MVLASTSCSMTMLSMSASPFSLIQGAEIKARVSASNANGFGPVSAVSTSNELVSVLPLKPLNTPRRGSSTTTAQIEVEWDAVTSPQSGGETITSYHVVWDFGTGTVDQTLIGDPTDFTGLSTIKNTGIVAG